MAIPMLIFLIVCKSNGVWSLFGNRAFSFTSDIDATLFQKSKKHSQDPQICKLLGLSGGPHKDKTPPMLAPVLFKDEDTRSMSKLFRSSALFQVCSIPIDSSKKKFIVVLFNILGFRLGA